ncbi:hypothetical protein CFC21_069807 [Triticum aestivum]|nr:hypothetical protein CFC21_069807 [Triticum aestivum]
MRKMSRASLGDDPETEREAKKPHLAEEEEVAGRTSHSEMIFAAFEHDRAQSQVKLDRVYDVIESVTEESSDPASPPLYEPYIPDELADRAANPGIRAAFRHAKAKYKAEQSRQASLFTMDHHRYKAPSCLFSDPCLLPIREPAKDAVLLAANSVIILSSSLESQPLNMCSGLWIQRDDSRKTAVVLTSAHLIRAKDPSKMDPWLEEWTGKYHREAKVIVHLLDNTTVLGRLLYLQEHYEFALYEVEVDKPVQLPTFIDSACSGQDVFRLGRDENLDLTITHGRVEYMVPDWYERCHYMYFSRDTSHNMFQDDGGLIIDLEGRVVGLVNNHINETFVPSSILHKCFDFWRRFKCIPRLHLGMTFTSIRLLDPICIERMRRKHSIEFGLIVEKVSKGSYAEKLGISKGDVIEGFNGKYISTTIELENMLIDICWDHFDQGNELNEEKHVSVKIFDANKLSRKTKNLTVIVSDHGEDIVKGTYPITGK